MMWEFLKTAPQYLLPQHFLSACMYRLTRWRLPAFKNALIRVFISVYKVDMGVAEHSRPEAYPCFNDFFTRKLLASARPVDGTRNGIVSPADGRISEAGRIDDKQLIQAKEKYFSLDTLLANDREIVTRFRDGLFSTIYLSPRDYHRIHMPVDGTLLKMTYVPGDLFSVNERTTRVVDGLFARNERLICIFETGIGLMCVVLVGAIFVGSMETAWQGEITPSRPRELRIWSYDNGDAEPIMLLKGAELGRFNMGSTVITLFEKDRADWLEKIDAGKQVVLGQLIGRARG